MSVVNAELPTLLDHARMMDPNGAIAKVVETLSKRSPLIQDAVFIEGNLPTGHQYTSEEALPSVYWRKLNQGILPSKARTGQVTEAAGILEGRSIVDRAVARLNGNEVAYRASQDMRFLRALKYGADSAFIYSSTATTPEQVHGIAPRLDSLAGEVGDQVVDGGGSGSDNTSIYIVCWSPETVTGFFPKGSKAGIEHTDMGLQYVDDGTGKMLKAYCTDWDWNLGFAVVDKRFIVRIANIDVSDLSGTGDTLAPLLIEGMSRIEDPDMGRTVIYCNRTIETMLRLQARTGLKSATLSFEDWFGRKIPHFDGMPIRRNDNILNTEAAVA